MEELDGKQLSNQEETEEQKPQPKTNFQIYCDEHPSALECRIYED